MTSTSKIIKKRYTLTLVLRQTHQLTLILIVALVKIQDLEEFAITPFSLSAQNVPVFAVLYCTEAIHGPCQLCTRITLIPSTNDASVVFSKLGGNINFSLTFSRVCEHLYTVVLVDQRISAETHWYPHYVHHTQPPYVSRMSYERIPMALLYSEFVFDKLNVGQLRLQYKDVRKCD